MINVRRALVATAIGAVCALSAAGGSEIRKATEQQSATVTIEELHPFTHVVSVPADSDLSSIKFEKIRAVRVATQERSIVDARYCEEAARRDSAGSIQCAHREFQSLVPAYEVIYSYRGQPQVSDGFASGYFTFSVYFRQDELSPALLAALSKHKRVKSSGAVFFGLTTSRDTVRTGVIDEGASAFCAGNFVDGSWRRANPECREKISSRTIAVPSNYITVKVDARRVGAELPASAAKSPR